LAVSSSFSPLKFDFPAPDGEAGPRCRATSDPNDNVLYHSLLGLASKCPTSRNMPLPQKSSGGDSICRTADSGTPASVMALLPATATGAGQVEALCTRCCTSERPFPALSLPCRQKDRLDPFTNRKFRDAGKAGYGRCRTTTNCNTESAVLKLFLARTSWYRSYLSIPKIVPVNSPVAAKKRVLKGVGYHHRHRLGKRQHAGRTNEAAVPPVILKIRVQWASGAAKSMQSPPCRRLTFNRLPSWKRNTAAPAVSEK